MIKNLLEILRYSELIKMLVGRDLKVRYKNSVLGFAWTWLDPLISMFIFIIVFDYILSTKVENFPVFLLTGLIPWTFFSNSVNGSVNSITSNAGLIKRVYYPREIYPLIIILGNGINMLLSILIMIPVIFLGFNISITLQIVLLPLPIFFLFCITFGLGLIFSSLNVFFRDTTYIGPFIIRLWFYLTPVFYIVKGHVPEKYFDAYMFLNPIAVILDLFRASLMGNQLPDVKYLSATFFSCSIIFIAGYMLFKKTEDTMVKMI